MQDNQFGTVGDTSWSSPVLTIARLSKDACDLSKHPAPRYQLRAPTAFNHEDQFCANDTARPFIHYRVRQQHVRVNDRKWRLERVLQCSGIVVWLLPAKLARQ